MSNLPLFYSSIAVLDREKNRDLRVVDGGQSAAFARHAHVIPAQAEEFVAACRELPIVFAMSNGRPAPVFVVGVETGKNAFVSDDGTWKGRYVPSYIRRYPFILGDVEGAGSLVCVDGGYQAPDEGGEKLFDADGANAAYLDSAIRFVNAYADASRRTDRFIDALVEHDLLRSVSVEVKPQHGPNAILHGLLSIDEAKLAELSDEAFSTLRKENMLPLVYSQLFSLGAFATVGDKVSEMASSQAA